EVVPSLFRDFLETDRVAVADLRPARDPWPHNVPEGVVGNLLGHGVDVADDLRAWPHEGHVALEDIPELRPLVHAEATEPAPDPRHPLRVVALPHVCCVSRTRGRIGHCPEFQEMEGPAAPSPALLNEEHRAA